MNVSRRTVLSTLGAGPVGLIAGCGGCRTSDAYRVVVELDSIAADDDGWDVTVTASTTIVDPDDDDTGSGRWEVALYDRDRNVLDTAVVDPVTWATVPESARYETDCGDAGAVSVTESFTVADVPASVGPRFRESNDVESYDPYGYSGLVRIGAVQYRGLDASRAPGVAPTASSSSGEGDDTGSEPKGDETGSESTGNDTPSESDGAETSSASAGGEWPPADVDAGEYETIEVSRLPWPTPIEQTIAETDAATDLEFTVESGCRRYRRPADASIDDRDGDVYVQWVRGTDRSCVRPILEDVTEADGTLTVVVGSNRVEHAYCRDCRYLEYRLRGTLREPAAGSIDEIAIEHHDDDGSVYERIVTAIE